MRDKPFNVIKANYPEMYEWLKQISRYGEVEKFVIPDYKASPAGCVRVGLYTKDHSYIINFRKETKGTEEENHKSYLGCMAQTRKPRAGEDWTRGNDLADGDYSEETWREIVNDIIGYELVKVVKQPREKNLDK